MMSIYAVAIKYGMSGLCLSSEDSPNLSYYLKFVKSEKVRISYATSFGTNKLNSKIIDLVKPELEKFKSIGVRENTGKAIVEKMGLNATLVIDPNSFARKRVI